MPSDGGGPVAGRQPRPFDRLRGRIAAALVGAVLVVAVGAYGLFWWWSGYQGDLLGAHRLGPVIARIIDGTEAGLANGRSAVSVIAPVADDDLTVRWQPGPEPVVPARWVTAATPGLPRGLVAIEGGPPRHALPVAPASREEAVEALASALARELRPASLLIQLPDASWLEFSSARYWRERTSAVKAGLAVALVFLGFLVVAVRLAAWLALPFERLADGVVRSDDPLHPQSLPVRGPVEAQVLASAVTRGRTALAEILEGRTRLLATISHDLRTPVTHLRLRAELIADEGLKAKFLADIENMQAMIAAILDFLVDDVLRETEEVISFTSLIQSLCDDYADMGQPVSFTAPPPLEFETVRTVFGGAGDRVSFDQERQLLLRARPRGLRRAFANLIENAIKYGDRADVTITADTRSIIIDVVDDGPGIPDDQLANVMKPFVRLHQQSEAAGQGGSGLGLSIVKSVVEAHGGQIELINRLRGGLRVRVMLPRVM